ncbi:DUF6527 family protein [Herbidospora yilanensis]|uniref:DUF6527 family protein n=1 Tax=Herbidospora yilanensis TaxID=354426 RepID=UPI0007C7B9C0|nr:DUF6527 family protein [Herbidospora yilanensis]
MTAAAFLRPEFVESFPSEMSRGILYVSIPYATCGHLCACGCGQEIVTPLSPAQWALTYDGENVSLRPSIGNWGLSCRSHYWIKEGVVRWSRRYTADEIDDNRARDRRDLQEHLDQDRPGPIAKLIRRLWR